MSQSTSPPPPPPSNPLPSTITIIGASLTGLSLALSLVRSSLFPASAITIYDRRPRPTESSSYAATSGTLPADHNNPNANTGVNPSMNANASSDGIDPATTSSGVILTPNGLAVLDSLCILERIKGRCWTATHRTFRRDAGPGGDGADGLVKKVRVSGEEEFGFRNHRCWRGVVVGELLRKVEGLGVKVGWEGRFEGVVRGKGEEGGVRFVIGWNDGVRDVMRTGMLVGADGVWSSVRREIDPDAKPQYTGTTGVLAHIRWEDVDWPAVPEGGEYERQCTLQGKSGALFWIPEDERGSVVMIGNQMTMEDEKSREELDRLARDKEYLCEFYRKDYEQWGVTGRMIIDAVCRNKESLYLWPFMRMAKLERWFSQRGDVVIMGDAAHALPPSSGQGVNQTLEDVYVLTEVLLAVKAGKKSLLDGLQWWQQARQDRIDDVFDWATNATNVQRLPQAERDKLIKAGGAKSQKDGDDMRWLYKPDWDIRIGEWLSTGT